MKQVLRVAQGFAISLLIAASSVHGQTIRERLAQLDVADRQWIENACRVHRDLGPAPYADCVERQLEGLKRVNGGSPTRDTTPNVPDQPTPAKSSQAPSLDIAGSKVRLGGQVADESEVVDSPRRRQSKVSASGDDCKDGAFATLKRAAALSESPNSLQPKRVQVTAGDQLVIVSSKNSAGHCRVVHVASGETGWIPKSLLVISNQAAAIRSTEVFARDSSVGHGDPEITIRNDADRTVTLDIDGRQMTIPSRQVRSLETKPGTYQFHASAPRTRPLLGSQSFSAGGIYTWTFYIRSRTNSSRQ